MPIAHISILAGRTAEQKEQLIEKVTEAIHESLGAPRENVRVLVVELPSTHWGIGGKSAESLGR